MRYALCISLGVRYNAARKGNENDNTFIIIYYDFVQETDKTISFGLFFFLYFFDLIFLHLILCRCLMLTEYVYI